MTPESALAPRGATVPRRLHSPLDVILMCVRWYVAYGLSLRNLGEVTGEHGIDVDHSTVHWRAIKLLRGLIRLLYIYGLSLRAEGLFTLRV